MGSKNAKVVLRMGNLDMGAGLAKIVKEYERRGNNLEDITPAVAQLLVSAVDEVFQTEGFGTWPDLAPATIRARRGTGAKMLQDRGILAGSITPRSNARTAEAFTRVPYGIYHVTGTKAVPKRNFLKIKLKKVTDQAAQIMLREVLK